MMPSSASYNAHWKLYPLIYEAQRIDVPIVIDGNHEKEVWNRVPWSETFGDIQGKDSPSTAIAAPPTQFKALYDEESLYICALLHPSEHFATETHFTDRNSPIFQKDSDFEVFVDPFMNNHNYKEFEVNAINTVWNLMLDKPYDDGGHEHSGRVAQPEEDDYYDVKRQESSVRILNGTINDISRAATWVLEMKMAYTDLMTTCADDDAPITAKFPPEPGTQWRINFSRVEAQGCVNWSWQPQIVWNPSAHKFAGKIAMHMPDAWGYLLFAGRAKDGNKGETVAARDVIWPAKLAAMHIYYAQHEYKKLNNCFASTINDLDSLIDRSIVDPLHFAIDANSTHFTVTTRMPERNELVSVQDNRLMTVHTG